MQQNEWRILVESRQRIAGRQWTAQRVANLCARELGEFEVPLNRVFASIHFRGATVKKPRAFAPIAHSINLFRAADPGDERASEQSLEVEREIGAQFPAFFEPRHYADRSAESGEILSRKNVDVIHVGISA